ncbi:glucosaminidase domain-containing protein, partial [Clostridium sartagoforme]|uniref:glucosaminidase domain-containing protein n=1 Tax=Clostridium sartagoforme TaxID=84031 RepID=UPI0031CE10D0
MSKFKKYVYILLITMAINFIAPSINAMADILNNNENTVVVDNYQNNKLNVEEKNLKYENVNNDLENNKSIYNSEFQSFNTSIFQEKSSSVIEGMIENITTPHKLTGDFFVKGYFVSTHSITRVEVFIDGNKIGEARYGVERRDIGSKYQYPNSINSGFEFPARGISNGSHELKAVATNSEGTSKESIVTIIVNNSKTSIMGAGILKREQMANFLHKNNSDKSMSYILNFVDLVISEASLEGINHDILFSQIMNETAFLKFTGDVKEEQNNFAGIGATGNGEPGNSFPSIQIGIRAVVQHLKAYASSEPLKMGLVDPRFNYVQRESAPYVEYLGIKENPNYKGWASAKEYGYRLLSVRSNVNSESSELKYSYLTDFKISGQAKVGNNITLVAQADKSSGIYYRFEILESGSNVWKVVGDWSSSNTIEYTPIKSGKYKFKVSIRGNSTIVDDHRIVDVDVINTISKISTINISGDKIVGEKLTFEAKGTPETDTLYRLWMCNRSTNTWILLSDWSTKNIVDYTPTKAGNYTFVAHVKHKTSNKNEEDDYKSLDVNVLKQEAKVQTINISGNKMVGEKLTFEA